MNPGPHGPGPRGCPVLSCPVVSVSGVLSGDVGSVAGSMVIDATEWGIQMPGDPVVRPDVTIEFSL